jgi:hypothetical protein
VKENEIDGSCRDRGEMRNAYTHFVGKFEVKRPLGRPLHR